MTIEKAIERMKSYKRMHTDDYFNMAIEALEKQVSKECIECGEEYVDKCRVCGGVITIVKQKYCDECGQRLKWEE